MRACGELKVDRGTWRGGDIDNCGEKLVKKGETACLAGLSEVEKFSGGGFV